jgi:ATP-dependent RNA helicase DeaD
MGFAEDVQWILSEAPAERQTLLFSATLPKEVRGIADKYLNDATHFATKSKTMTLATVQQRVCVASPHEKLRLLSRILESEPTEGVIVFVKTKELSSRLAENLCQRGYLASALNGDMQQQQRERTVERLKAGKLNVVVATDVAARGLDVERISHVVNYDFPHDTEAYVHRIGRTGRAGREGHAILFISPREKHRLRYMEKATGQKMTWMEKPTNDTIQAGRAAKLQKQLAETLAKENLSVHSALITNFLAENPDTKIEDVAAGLAIIAMGGRDTGAEIDDRPRRREDRGNGGREQFDRKSDRRFGKDARGGGRSRFDRKGDDSRGP